MSVVTMTAAALADISSIDGGTTATPCRLTAVEVQPHQGQVNEVYVQLFNVLASGVTLGATAPNMVITVGSRATQGGGDVAGLTTAGGGATAHTVGSSRTFKVLFPGGGFRFGTTLSAAITTTPGGNTAASTTSLPARIKFFFTPYGN